MKNTKSQDKLNRKTIRTNVDIPTTQTHKYTKYHREAISYIDNVFTDHRGSSENINSYPINSTSAYKNFDRFLKTKLLHFGDYQDAIIANESILFHSNLSASLNLGLLDPRKLVRMTVSYISQNDSIPINNSEGFLRQIIGWREYMRYLYTFRYQEMINSNIPGNKKRLSREWFNGNIHMVLGFSNIISTCGFALEIYSK